jgi:REP element-mobilizing transposase RayT
MVHGYHVIFTTYGFWLPNDPRGSWSDFVGAWELRRFGPATKVDTRTSVAHQPHDTAVRQAAKEALKFPPVQFSGLQARAVGRGFAKSVRRGGLIVWACAILPEHVHMVLGRLGYPVEYTVNLLKGSATRELLAEKLHPFGDRRDRSGRVPHCWARGRWKVYLNTPEDIQRAIAYVEENPAKEGKPKQTWSFVTPFTSV